MRWVPLVLLARASALSLAPRRATSGHALRSCERVAGSNATVVIQGVLHGAASSAAAVQDALDAHAPAVVVLELCPARARSLAADGDAAARPADVGDEFRRVVSGARRVARDRGAAAGATAAVLGALYAVSRAAGFRPGVEFAAPPGVRRFAGGRRKNGPRGSI